MNILILNVGSSSIKYSIFSNEKLLLKGSINDIHKKSEYSIGIHAIMTVVKKNNLKIDAVGHRIVHGGTTRQSKIISPSIINLIKKYSEFAPVHNIPELIGIHESKKLFKVPHIAVFDTAFHSVIPPRAFLYGIPYKYYSKHGIRRYGFHGISYKYASEKSSEILKKPLVKLKLIIAHLGHGCSVDAIDKGVSVDTSMGLTPLEGIMMTNRSGDVDAGLILHLMAKEKFSLEQMNNMLNKKSGLQGLSGISDNMRVLLKSKNRKARIAIDVFTYRIAKYIGAYVAVLKGVDAIVFTGGIGENSAVIREKILSYFDFMGLKLDSNMNKKNSPIISKKDSKIKAVVVPADEELMIAREVLRLFRN